MAEGKQSGLVDELVTKLHGDHCKLAWDAIRSSSDDYDKNVLQLSSALLALSMSFMKDLVHPAELHHYYSLYVSWSSFGVAIIAVIFSFQFSIAAHKCHLTNIDEYYLKGKHEALAKGSRWDKYLTFTNFAAGAFFFLGVICTIVFVISNFRS